MTCIKFRKGYWRIWSNADAGRKYSGENQHNVYINIQCFSSILLLDEPFSALDLEIRTELAQKIKELQTKIGIPLLFITHNLEEVFLLADRILVLYGGKAQQFGTPEEIFHYPKNLHLARLVGISNIFDDAYVEEYDN